MATSQIFKRYQYVCTSRKHILEMLEDRGFDISELTEYTHDEIKTMLTSHTQGKFESKSEVGPLDIFLEKKNDNETGEKEKIYVKYRLDDKFKRTTNLQLQITEIFENLLTTKDTLIILNVGRVLIKPGAKEKPSEDFVNSLLSKGHFVQLFGLENFLFNVNRHVFVPKHRIISKKELHDFIEHYSCTLKNIPTIKRDDPQAKYIGLRPKQVCEITAVNLTSGTTVRYRICVL
uniref:RNA polymerase subunit H/Rpb5 C-terminal domain-containing protein n=1 Tax=viral metagenome TaxID=1070528 RepID=A0A6C0HLE8_9ZZZZ